MHSKESRMYDPQVIHGFRFWFWIIAALGQTSSCFLLFCVVLSFPLVSVWSLERGGEVRITGDHCPPWTLFKMLGIWCRQIVRQLVSVRQWDSLTVYSSIRSVDKGQANSVLLKFVNSFFLSTTLLFSCLHLLPWRLRGSGDISCEVLSVCCYLRAIGRGSSLWTRRHQLWLISTL